VLHRYDMFNVVDQFAIPLVEPAIFATLGSPLPDEVPRRRIHLLLNLRVQLLPRFELEEAFVIRRGAVVSPLSERIDSFLNRCGNLQLDYPARGFNFRGAGCQAC